MHRTRHTRKRHIAMGEAAHCNVCGSRMRTDCSKGQESRRPGGTAERPAGRGASYLIQQRTEEPTAGRDGGTAERPADRGASYLIHLIHAAQDQAGAAGAGGTAERPAGRGASYLIHAAQDQVSNVYIVHFGMVGRQARGCAVDLQDNFSIRFHIMNCINRQNIKPTEHLAR